MVWNESGITPYYLFQFTNQQTQETKLFVADNVASFSAQSRYDEFYIVETGNTYTNLSAATLNLYPSIFWEYVIYEQTDQYNFNTGNTVSAVEYGRVYVDGYEGFIYDSYTGQTGSHFVTYNSN